MLLERDGRIIIDVCMYKEKEDKKKLNEQNSMNLNLIKWVSHQQAKFFMDPWDP